MMTPQQELNQIIVEWCKLQINLNNGAKMMELFIGIFFRDSKEAKNSAYHSSFYPWENSEVTESPFSLLHTSLLLLIRVFAWTEHDPPGKCYYLDISPESDQILGDGIKLQVLEKAVSSSEKNKHQY